MTTAAPPPSIPDDGRPAAYAPVEGLHLRQVLVRAAAPLGVLATNGAAWIDVAGLPRHDAPLAWIGAQGEATTAAAAALVAAGAALVAASAVLRVLAKGVLVRKTTVTTCGVYARVRHPYYLANLLGGAGTLALAGPLGAVAAAAWLAAALPVFLVTIRGEEAGLRGLHGAAWDAYAARVPRLLPLGRPRPEDAARATWANLVAEGEPPRGLRLLGGAAAVAACRTGGVPGVALACGAAALFAASYVVPRATRRPRGG